MLGKLLKYELKHSARYVMSIYGCALAASIFMLLGMLVKVTWITVVGSILLYFIGIACVIVTVVAVIKNFYDTLYGKQGYLTFTLPVKCKTLLFSKVLVSFFWIILSCVLMAVIFALIFLNAKNQTADAFVGIIDAIKVSGILDTLPSFAMIVKFLLILAFVALMYMLTFVGFVYFSVTVANTRALQNHPKLFGFLIFFLIYSVTNSLSATFTSVLPLSVNITSEKVYFALSSMNSETVVASFGLGGSIFMGAVAVLLLFATGWIMEHKVNIK